MILVADRCAISPTSMASMKAEIFKVVSNWVDVASDEQGSELEVNMTTDAERRGARSGAMQRGRCKRDGGKANDVFFSVACRHHLQRLHSREARQAGRAFVGSGCCATPAPKVSSQCQLTMLSLTQFEGVALPQSEVEAEELPP